MIPVLTAPLLNIWQTFPRTPDEVVAKTNPEVKRGWGERFKNLGPAFQSVYNGFGPVELFDVVMHQIHVGEIEIRAKVEPGKRRGDFNWRVEYRLTPGGRRALDEWKELNK